MAVILNNKTKSIFGTPSIFVSVCVCACVWAVIVVVDIVFFRYVDLESFLQT